MYIYIYIYTHIYIYSQTQIYSETFNISHIISQFIHYSLDLIMSDKFDRKVCNGLQSTKNYLALKFKYTIRQYQFRSTNYQAMLNFVQSMV